LGGATGGLSDASKAARAFSNRGSLTTLTSAFCASMSADRHASDLGASLHVVIALWELGADGRYVRACAATGGKIDPVPGCGGLVLDLDALWAKVDELLAH
jgi:hypothetical protein